MKRPTPTRNRWKPGRERRRAADAAAPRQPGTRARGPGPEPSRLGRQLAVVPLVLAVLGAVYAAPHAAAWTRTRIRQEPFRVERITVQGLERVEAAALRERLAAAQGAALVDLDVAALEAAIEAHPWIAEATVLRWPPDGLRLRVEEHEPLAVTAAGEPGRLHVVNATGTAFAPASQDDVARLVALAVDPPAQVGAPDPRLVEGLRLAAGLHDRGLEVPRRVTLGLPERAASAELRLRGFAPAIFVERGVPEAQLDRLATLLAANVGPAVTARVIDLRFEGRAVLWGGPEAEAP